MGNDVNNNYDDEIIDPEDIIVTLDLEEDGEVDCSIVSIFDMDFEGQTRDYIALLEIDSETGEPTDDSEILLYRYKEDADGTADVEYIESDAEFEAVSAEFDRLVNEMDA